MPLMAVYQTVIVVVLADCQTILKLGARAPVMARLSTYRARLSANLFPTYFLATVCSVFHSLDGISNFLGIVAILEAVDCFENLEHVECGANARKENIHTSVNSKRK